MESNEQVSDEVLLTILRRIIDASKRSGNTGQGQFRKDLSPSTIQNRHFTPEMIEQNRRNILNHQLIHNEYECVVCCEKIHEIDQIWSCLKCHTIFHFSCILTWAISSMTEEGKIQTLKVLSGNFSKNKRNSIEVGIPNENWPCPGCRQEYNTIPEIGTCFCHSTEHPEINTPRSGVPHSCGGVCSRPRANQLCPHICPIRCHPGPCPGCKFLIERACHCGKVKILTQCGGKTFTCNNICGLPLNCKIHTCQRQCHEDPCKDCTKTVIFFCECGNESKILPCSISNSQEKYYCGGYGCNGPTSRLSTGCKIAFSILFTPLNLFYAFYLILDGILSLDDCPLLVYIMILIGITLLIHEFVYIWLCLQTCPTQASNLKLKKYGKWFQNIIKILIASLYVWFFYVLDPAEVNFNSKSRPAWDWRHHRIDGEGKTNKINYFCNEIFFVRMKHQVILPCFFYFAECIFKWSLSPKHKHQTERFREPR